MPRSTAQRRRGTLFVGTLLVGLVLCLVGSFPGPKLAAGEPGVATPVSTTPSGQLNWVRKGSSPSHGTTQHSLSLASPVGATFQAARPQVTVLRWRTPDAAQTRFQASDATVTTKIVTLSSVSGSSHPVRQVSATDADLPAAIPDAFTDPFDDGVSQAPMAVEPPAPLLVEPTAQLLAQQPSGPATPDETWQDDPVPAPQVLPAPMQDDMADDLQEAPKRSCGRIYNRRDCCADEERCTDARRKWDLDAISKISLDITPSLRPDELNPYTEEEERDKDLAESPVRTWRDRAGNALGTGRITNIKHGRLLVLNADNQILDIPFDDLSDDDLCFLTAWWRVPTECTFGDEQFAGRNWAPSTMTWKASALCHKPLYFEEVQLERYGHTAGPLAQPVLSGAHFFLNLVTVPYQAGINPPWECRYALGYYRPGSCAPWLVPPVPLSLRGALWQAGAVVGGVALFP